MRRKVILNSKHILNYLLIIGFFVLISNSDEFEGQHEIKFIQSNGTR